MADVRDSSHTCGYNNVTLCRDETNVATRLDLLLLISYITVGPMPLFTYPCVLLLVSARSADLDLAP